MSLPSFFLSQKATTTTATATTGRSQSGIPVIFLVDASGSTVAQFGASGMSIFLKQGQVVQQFMRDQNMSECRLLFWNHAGNTRDNFRGGLNIASNVWKIQAVNQVFQGMFGFRNDFGGTDTHIAFDNVPDAWISKTEKTLVFLVTDGETNSRPDTLLNSIKKFFDRSSMIELSIFTVESRDRDFSGNENLSNTAGSDVFNIISRGNMTNRITKFVAHTKNYPNGVKLMERINVPPGYIGYKSDAFHEKNTNEFIQWLYQQITANRENENELTAIIQGLSSTIGGLVKDKPVQIAQNILRTFCGLFNNTVMDPSVVHWMLSMAVSNETSGNAQLLSTMRSQLKELFKQANELLYDNTANALGMHKCVSFIFDDKVMTGSASHVSEMLSLNGKNFPNSAIKIRDYLIPVFSSSHGTLLNDQCTRQWARTVVSVQYGVDSMSDKAMYMVLGLMLRVVVSNVSDEVKRAYRNLGTIMLQKKRLNSTNTELSVIENGDLLVPNSGKLDELYRNLSSVGGIIGLHNVDPMVIWYAMCIALGNQTVINKQLPHCFEDLKKMSLTPESLMDFIKTKLTPVTSHNLQEDSRDDYRCLITLSDTTTTGGLKIYAHNSLSGVVCAPNSVFSHEGVEGMTQNQSLRCPYCYCQLGRHQFFEVGPYIVQDTVEITANYPNVFVFSRVSNARSSSTTTTTTTTSASSPQSNNVIVVLRGTVGSGKSAISSVLKATLEANGKSVVIANTDQYAKSNGGDMRSASDSVKNDIQAGLNNGSVIIIDICNENLNTKNLFGYDLSKCKIVSYYPNIDMKEFNKDKQSKFTNGYTDGYMAWTLRNVLQRDASGPSTPYWLNPHGASVKICIDVHTRKAKTLFGGNIPNYSTLSNDQTTAISILNPKADGYMAQLKPVQEQVNQIIEKINN